MSVISSQHFNKNFSRRWLSLLESEECIDIMMDGKLLEQNVLKLKMLQQLMRLNKWEIKFVKSIYA